MWKIESVVYCASLRTAVSAPRPRYMVVRVTMDLFQHRYYRLGKILMSLIGQWPYQSIRARRGIVAVLILLSTYQIVTQILAVVTYWEDRNILLQCLVPNIVDAVCATKFLGFMCNPEKTLKLLNRIRTDWEIWAGHRDVNILHAYAERGKNITILYTALWYSASIVYMVQPMVTKLIDVVLKNDTQPGKFPFPVVFYHLDMHKYYFHLSMFCTVYALFIVTALIASDIMLIIYVQHVCSIFAAVGQKFDRIGNHRKSIETGENHVEFHKTDMVYLVSCIDRHNDAIEYADLIKASYAWNFFFSIGFAMILLNSSALEVLLRTNDPAATLILISVILDIISYLYAESYISQILIDHSISIRFSIYNSQWYRLSPKAQKVLQFMLMRCNFPCHLTVGNMLTMSLRTFGMVIKTFLSYLTCLRSMSL